MRKSLFLLLFTLPLFLTQNVLGQDDYSEIKNLLSKDPRQTSQKVQEHLAKDKTPDYFVIGACLADIEGRTSHADIFTKGLTEFSKKNSLDISPYIFSLWYSSGFTSGSVYFGEEKHSFLESTLELPNLHFSQEVALKYILSFEDLRQYNLKTQEQLCTDIGALTDWRFVGVFDNTSGSGFYKEHEPISHPEASKEFISKKNSRVKWFKPLKSDVDPWVTFTNCLPSSQGVVFAQTFVNSETNQEALFCFGGEGAMKIWLNDKLIFEEEEELRTELDYYIKKINLPKGNNRILVQVGHTEKSDYSNFLLRLINPETKEPLNNITVSSDPSKYNSGESVKVIESTPHFAEQYFSDEIKRDSSNILNYVMLSKCYRRARKNNEAIEILELAKRLDSTNLLVNTEFIQNYIQISDRTALMLQLEDVRSLDEDLIFIKLYDYSIAMDNEDFRKAEEILEELEATNFSDVVCRTKRIGLLSAQKDYKQMLIEIEEAYQKHPDIVKFIELKYIVEKNKSQSVKKSVPILKKYLKKKYNYRLMTLLINEYKEIGDIKNMNKLLDKNIDLFQDELEYYETKLFSEYSQENFVEAYQLANQMIGINPYNSVYYSNRAYIELAMDQVDRAREDMLKAIHYNPNSFDSREKVRMIDEKESWTEIFENEAAYDIIKKSFKEDINEEEPYEYLFYEENMVFFEEGAGVEYTSMAIRILNNSGIETWKELSINYNYSSEDLYILKSELNKANGQRMEGERNYNQVVFPNIEIGDVIYLEFRKDRYTGGKLAKQISLSKTFSKFANSRNVLFRVYAHKSTDLKLEKQNMSTEIKTYDFEDYKCYEYKNDFIEKLEDETYMPYASEIGEVLYLTNIDSWSTISEWYSDIALPMAKEDYNLNQVYQEIFPSIEGMTDYEKAERIYDYICDNITYSSVSFRQSNYIPQKPMVTISTKLGDCKDVSNLYYTLARKAGLKTNLVLVSTRDNGESDLKIPSIAFNHCIIRIDLGDTVLYQELTDKYLPFGSLPNNLRNSQCLVIPAGDNEDYGKELIQVPNFKLVNNTVDRKVNIKIEDDIMKVNTTVTLGGEVVSDYKWYFTDLAKDEMKDRTESYCNDYFDSEISVEDFQIYDSLEYDKGYAVQCTVHSENEIKKIGQLRTFSIPFFEEIFTMDNLPDDERKYPLNYWEYENKEVYNTDITIEIPDEFNFEEVPADFSIKTPFIEFDLDIEKLSDTKISISRRVKTFTRTIPAENYEEFRETAKKISKLEELLIGYK